MKDYVRFFSAHRRFLTYGFALTFFSSFGQTFFLSLFSADFRSEFGLTHGSFGSLYSLATLASGLTMLWLGRQIDRYDLRRFTLAVCVGLIASAFFMATISSQVLLVLAMFAMRLTGQGLMSHTASTTMARYFERGRGKAISLASLGFSAGEAMFPPIGVAVAVAVGWRMTWVGVGTLLAIVLVPLTLWLLRGHEQRHEAFLGGAAVDAEPARSDVPSTRLPGWTQRQVIGDPRFWLVIPSIVACAFLMTGFFFHQVHLVETKGWDLQWYTLCFTGFALAQLVATLFAGPLVDRHGAHYLLPFYLVPIAAGLLVLAFFDHPGSALAYLTLAGLSGGASATIGGALWAEAYGTTHLGAIRAMVTALFVLSTAASPVLFGQLLDRGVTIETIALLGVGWLVVAGGSGTLAFRGNVRRAPGT